MRRPERIVSLSVARTYHKLRAERHGALELGDEALPPPEVARARDLGRRFTLNQCLTDADASELLQLLDAGWGLGAAPLLCFETARFAPLPPLDLPQLPPGYGFKGGAARYALRKALHPRAPAPAPRDLDLLRFGARWCDEDSELSRLLMPHDFERGNGVELVPDQSRYFCSRDVSINEVFVLGREAVCTLSCLLDTLGRVLRPCHYRSGSLHREASLRGRTLLKMLRLCAEAAELGEQWAVVGVPDQVAVDDFELAIELNKALFRGEAAAQRFVSLCIEGELFACQSGGAALADVIAELSRGLYAGLDFFDELTPRLREKAEALLPSAGKAGDEG